MRLFFGGLLCTNNNFYAFSAFSFSGFQAGNDARAVWRKASKKAVVKCRLNGNA
jgi:hypothetical protein